MAYKGDYLLVQRLGAVHFMNLPAQCSLAELGSEGEPLLHQRMAALLR